MAKVFSYELDGNLYMNLTNYCSNRCDFCVGSKKNSYYGWDLSLDYEPSAAEVLGSIDFSKNYGEYVFCGMGEPTARIDVISEVGAELKTRGLKTRINTNGQGNLINGCDITEKLCRVVDVVNVSLNMPTAQLYQDECHSCFGEEAFSELLDFAVKCRNRGAQVVLSVVDCIGEDLVNRCRTVAESVGIPLKVRAFIQDS